MPDQPIIYGIANCGTIKKVRSWLDEHDIDYHFHDYKKQGVDRQQLIDWLGRFGWEQLINKRGTTWRKLDENIRETMNDELALEVMIDNPSIIRRPVLLKEDKMLIGFDAAQYQQEFARE